MIMVSALIIPTAANAATASSAAKATSQVHVVRAANPALDPHSIVVSVKVASIPSNATIVQVGGQTLLSTHGTVVARVISPGYAAAKADLAQRTGSVSFLLTGRAMSTNAAPGASPRLSVGYGCLVQTWPGTNVHPCGYVISNPVAQGIFNALKVLGSAAAVAACTAALVGLGDSPAQAGSVCAIVVGIIAGFINNLGNKCLFIVVTPSWLAGHLLAVNC
jgi:hypothetical protein